MSNCPNADVLAKYASGSLLEGAAESISAHLEQCPDCQRLVDDIFKQSDSLVDAMRRPVADTPTRLHPQLPLLIASAKQLRARARPAASRSIQVLPPDDVVALDVFVAALNKCGLLEPGEVDSLVDSIVPSDTESFARELVVQRKLTPFQAGALLQGRWKGLVLGNYIILDKIGQGGMGHVFKAKHRRMGRVVCIKVLSSAGRKSPQLVERFRREATAIAALNHPNIVVAHDADEADGIHFLVMEFIEGIDLARLVAKYGPLPVDQALPLVLQVARALEYAHRKGIVHRDVKPHNLLLTPHPSPPSSHGGPISTKAAVIKILDMGLARFDAYLGDSADTLNIHGSMTNSGIIMGTVDYMSPEQALNSRHADGRSDIYSLGCTLCFLLTGRVMFDGETVMEKLVAHRERAVPSLRAGRKGIPIEVDAIFQQMVAKAPGRRYESMSDLAGDLERFLSGGKPQALERIYGGLNRVGKKGTVWAGLATAAAVLCALAVWREPQWLGRFHRDVPLAGTTPEHPDDGDTSHEAIEVTDVEPEPESKPSANVVLKTKLEKKFIAHEAKPATAPCPPPSDFGADPRVKLVRNGGPGRVLVVVSHTNFHELDYSNLVKSLEANGIDFVPTSSRAGPATSQDGKVSVDVPRAFGDCSIQDFDAVVFSGGDIREFNHESPDIQRQVQELVSECVTERRVVAAVGNGCGVIEDTDAWQETTFGRYRELQLGALKDQPVSIVGASDPEQADTLVRFIFHELIGGHPNTLAHGGPGRAMVVVSPRGFHAAEYRTVCSTLKGWGIDVVTASTTGGTATPDSKQLEPVPVDATLDDFAVRDFDALIFCGGNVVDFKSPSMLQKIRRIVDACLSQQRVVATVGNANVVLKEAGFLDGDLRSDQGLQINSPKNRFGKLMTAPPKQADSLIEVLFGDVLHKDMQQPRKMTAPK
jgi:serine/threonine protein kinase/putative intracellular protease/amidase